MVDIWDDTMQLSLHTILFLVKSLKIVVKIPKKPNNKYFVENGT